MELLYGPPRPPSKGRAEPDLLYVHTELRRPGVTLELLHLEYLREHPEGYRYTAYCDRYRAWQKRLGLWMRQVHRGGEKAFVDYSGKRPSFIDPATGECVVVEFFVGVLGASSLTFAFEATLTQRVPDFLGSHVRMFEYFGGVPQVVVPDQLKSAVTVASRSAPVIQRTYADLGRHYGTAIVPARPRKPRDKAKVEVAVQIAQRWILARLRNETFFSLETRNARVRELVDELNLRPMKRRGGKTRRALFESLDKPALKALPSERYVLGEWSTAKVHGDHHVEVDRHYYSAPHGLHEEMLDVCLTATTVELLYRGDRVALHPRSYEPYGSTTLRERPPARPITARGPMPIPRACSPGLSRSALRRQPTSASVDLRPTGLRSALGLKRVAEPFERAQIEAACAEALRFDGRSCRWRGS